jgi:CelD/BcsL family acetyltransferase involved in cellulose biosynthesis
MLDQSTSSKETEHRAPLPAMPAAERVADLTLEPIDSFAVAPEEWSALAQRSGNLFSTREWAETWWRHFGEDRPLLLTACREPGGRLVGVLPLYLASGRPVRTLRFLGHGPADQLGPVCEPGDRAAVAAALKRGLRERLWPWDVFIAERLSGAEGWASLVGGRVLGHESSPVMTTGGLEWDAYLASRSSNFRQQVTRRERKLGREYEISYRLADRASFESDFERLVQLHELRWGERSPAFVGPLAGFHRDFASVALDRGWLRLWSLEVDGTTVAAWHGFRFGGLESYYQSGRDPEWDSYRVGFVLLTHTMREAFNDGMGEYRMLRGAEAYKDRFANQDHGIETFTLSRGVGRAASAIGGAARRTMPARVRRRLARLAG